MDDTAKRKIADQFFLLADRLLQASSRATDPAHLATHIYDYGVTAGRLFVQSVDGHLFPEHSKDRNRGWWDRSIARLPGALFVIYGGIPDWTLISGQIEIGNLKIALMTRPDSNAAERIRRDAMQPFQPVQFWRSWIHAVGLWLTTKFPERFRFGAAAWDWWSAASDEKGRLLDKSGRILRGHWFRNGELVNPSQLPKRKRNAGK